jgi:hypothetical protein
MPTQPPIPGILCLGCEADHSPPSNTEAKTIRRRYAAVRVYCHATDMHAVAMTEL